MKSKQQQVVPSEIDTSELPVSGAVRVARQRGYGTISDLGDEQPADANELQRLVAWELYGPLLALRGRNGRAGDVILTAGGDEVDWARVSPVIARRQPQAGAGLWQGSLRERLERALRSAALLRAGIPGTAKYLVLAYVRMGILPIEEVTNEKMRRLAELDREIRRLSEQLGRITPWTAARARAMPAGAMAQQ